MDNDPRRTPRWPNDSYSTGSNHLDVLHEMTEAAQKQMRDTMSRSQDVVVDAVSAWSETVQKLIPASMPTKPAGGTPKPADLVDSGFKIAEQLLAAQHELARRLLHAVEPVRRRRLPPRGRCSADRFRVLVPPAG